MRQPLLQLRFVVSLFSSRIFIDLDFTNGSEAFAKRILLHEWLYNTNLMCFRWRNSSMKKGFCVVVIGLLFIFSGELAYSQEHEQEQVPRALPGRPPMPMPGGPMVVMMGPGGRAMSLQALRDNPKRAGMI